MKKDQSLVIFLTVMSSLIMLGEFAMSAFLPALGLLAKDFNVGESIAQQTVSSYFLGYALISMVTGPWADSIGRKKLILISSYVFLFATIGCIFATDIKFLIMMRLLQGACAGSIWTIGRVMTFEVFPEERAKQAIGILAVIFSFGPALAPVVGGWMVSRYTWSGTFYVMAFVSIITTLLAIVFLPETLDKEQKMPFSLKNILSNYKIILTNKRSLSLFLAIILLVGANYVYISASHRFLVNLLGLKPTQFAYLYWPLMAANLLAAIVNVKITYRMNGIKVLLIVLILMGVASLSNITMCYFGVNNIFILAVPIAVYSFGQSVILPILVVNFMGNVGVLQGFASALISIGLFLINSLIAGAILPLIWNSTLNIAILQLVVLILAAFCCFLIIKYSAIRTR